MGVFPSALAWSLRGLGVLAFVLTLSRLRRPGALPAPRRPDAASWRTYQVSVLLMVLALSVGARLLTLAGQAPLVVLWVVFAVGAHFYPFAQAFGAAVFRQLAFMMVGTAALFASLFALGWEAAPAVGAVVAGAVMLWYSAGLGQPPGAQPDTASGARG
ncbi:hypothetical protein [Deinococcus sp. NW-56]|uniref:hypothetical protein n=1 Tax=Deinococcus sp. NW-56 TaxID=2080419 RepID=UPI001319D49C|nr:hypothetical protein [Deinococcus sp. NW-56]